jgi:undecaprenyl-diphosphatase
MFVQTTVVSACKRLSSIDRPPQIVSPVFLTTGSYPSGHSASSLMSALLVPTILMPYLPLSVLIILATFLVCVALLTAYGRLYLDVHWLTDIVGGWVLAGATYLFSCQFLS